MVLSSRFHYSKLAGADNLDYTAPGAHQFGTVVERRHVADQNGGRSWGPRRSGYRDAWHGRQHSQRGSRGRGHSGIGGRVAHAERRNVDDRNIVHDGGGGRPTSQNLIGRQHNKAARSYAEAALHHGAHTNLNSHNISF